MEKDPIQAGKLGNMDLQIEGIGTEKTRKRKKKNRDSGAVARNTG
jgi:hypothetical protein